ncbi:hypothetical protein ACIQWN_36525 [Streptomyces vinaceus]|uniref:hypothetical protein n=1 Tax=Streptomyces vinaceus TaxID=1960 RepID=UPI0037FAE216
MTATDVMRFDARSAASTRMASTASLRFKGFDGVAEPFLRAQCEKLAAEVEQPLPSAAEAR